MSIKNTWSTFLRLEGGRCRKIRSSTSAGSLLVRLIVSAEVMVLRHFWNDIFKPIFQVFSCLHEYPSSVLSAPLGTPEQPCIMFCNFSGLGCRIGFDQSQPSHQVKSDIMHLQSIKIQKYNINQSPLLTLGIMITKQPFPSVSTTSRVMFWVPHSDNQILDMRSICISAEYPKWKSKHPRPSQRWSSLRRRGRQGTFWYPCSSPSSTAGSELPTVTLPQ